MVGKLVTVQDIFPPHFHRMFGSPDKDRPDQECHEIFKFGKVDQYSSFVTGGQDDPCRDCRTCDENGEEMSPVPSRVPLPHNPTPIAIDVSDDLSEDERSARVRAIAEFSYNYIGREPQLDAIAIRSTQHDPAAFASAVTAVAAQADLPLILCTYDAAIMATALAHIRERRPLLYAATKDNWKEMAELSLRTLPARSLGPP